MKKSGITLLLIGGLLSMLMSPACSTTEEQAIVYDITGLWQFTVTVPGISHVSNFSFAGSLTTGIASDLTNGRNGIYNVNNTNVEIIFSFFDPICEDTTEYFTGVFTTPTTMSGTFDADVGGPCIVTPGITWTAVKL